MTTADALRARMQNKPGVVGATIILRSGNYFDFLAPETSPILIEDIAWGLAYTCRFGGQSTAFWSVAQHSIEVSRIVDPAAALEGLLHDAAEAYVGDIVGPLKQLLPEFRAIEKRVEAAIAKTFSLRLDEWHDTIKHADLRLLRTEQRDLTNGSGDNWSGLDRYVPLPHRLSPMTPEGAALSFMMQFQRLMEIRTTYRVGGPK